MSKRVMQAILSRRNPVWFKDQYPTSKLDGHFLEDDGISCVYKCTNRSGSKKELEDWFEYYLQMEVIQELVKFRDNKGTHIGYFIIVSTGETRKWKWIYFDVDKYLAKYNDDPPTRILLENERTQDWFRNRLVEPKKVQKLNAVFNEFDITKDGTIIIPKQSRTNKKGGKWKPRS